MKNQDLIVKNYVPSFDIIRAIAIIMVLCSHLGLKNLLPNNNYIKENIWTLFSGSTAVMIFFCLSGFLITSILIKEKQNTGTISIKKFLLKRVYRLFPAILVFHFILFLLIIFKVINVNFFALLLSIFYLYNYVPKSLYYLELGHIWSLAVEQQFYFIFPFLFKWFYKMKLVLVIAFLIIISLVFKFYFGKHISIDYKTNRWFFPAIIPIFMGCLGAIFYIKISKLSNHYLLIISVFLYLFPIYSIDFLNELNFLFISFGVVFLLIYLAKNAKNQQFKSGIFSPILYIGKISYGIYLFQGIFLRTGPGSKIWFQNYPFHLILTFITAILSYELIEKRFYLIKNKIK